MTSAQAEASPPRTPAGEVMDSVDSYLAKVLSVIRPLAPRRLGLADADGAVLAEDVTARFPLPSFDNSAMDGYAVMACDVAAATPETPVTLPVTAEVPAGDTRRRKLAPGTCMRIMTGALLPAGADAVVRIEWAEGGTGQVTIRQAARPGSCVRRSGTETRPGQVLLTAGTRLGPQQVGLLAAAGHGGALARPRPRLAVLSAGDELAEPGGSVIPGQTWESNSYMLAAAARQAGCVPRRHPVVRDDQDAVLAAVRGALADADLLVTSGGISMGADHDSVKAALQHLGTVTFRKVAMQPGMPQGFGTAGPSATPILTLPGNPVSAFVSFQLFGLPAVRALQGLPRHGPRTVAAVLTAPLRSPAGKSSFICGVLDPGQGTVTPVSAVSSHHLTTLSSANALIIVPGQVTALSGGDAVDVLGLAP
jgi:molybdopterin molybdotransferase